MSIKFNRKIKDELNEILSGLYRLNELNYEIEAECVRIEFENNHPVYILEEFNSGSELKAFINRPEGGRIYFDVKSTHGSIYDNVGDCGWSEDQKLYVMYGKQPLYQYTEAAQADDEQIYSEEELRVWFEFAQDGGDPSVSLNYQPDEFNEWLNDTCNNGYMKTYRLFDVQKDEEYLDELFNKSNN